VRGTTAAPLPSSILEVAYAFLLRAIEIIVRGVASRLCRSDERIAQRVRLAYIRNRKRPIRAVPRILAAFLMFGFL